MRILLQRVTTAAVWVNGKQHSSIGTGLLLFVGFGQGDATSQFPWMARKILTLRLFPDKSGRPLVWNSVTAGVSLLVVPQFTLYARLDKGCRPSFSSALPPEAAQEQFSRWVAYLRQMTDLPVQTGVFGADMQVSLTNDGPFTLWLERHPPDQSL